MKTCNTCLKSKRNKSFYKKKDSKNGLSNRCKTCSDNKVLKLKRTKNGLVNVIYATQKQSSKRRNHVLPNYSKDQLSDWILSQPNFDELYNNWVASNYKKDLKPSIDRLEDNLPYTLKNIRLTYWKDNSQKRKNQIKINDIKEHSIPVIQIKDNIDILHFSIKEAERKTGVPNSNIIAVCKGRRKTAGGFIWLYYK